MMMGIALKGFAGAFVLHAAIVLFPVMAAAGNCPVIEPNYQRICGTIDPQFLRQIDEVGGCFLMSVSAKSKWNASGIRFEHGLTYSIEVLDKEALGKDQTWTDAGIETDAEGWTVQSLEDIGRLKRYFLTLVEPLRRAPEYDWFYLMGMVAEVGEEIFPIGKGAPHTVEKKSGEFCAFANDLPFKYGNNSGKLKIRVSLERQ